MNKAEHTAKIKSPFSPVPGWIIAIPYIEEEKTFKSDKVVAGEAQKSEVLAVGDSFIDDHGNLRTPPCKVGDIIIHSYIQNDYETDFNKFRAIKFFEVIGVKK